MKFLDDSSDSGFVVNECGFVEKESSTFCCEYNHGQCDYIHVY